MLACCDRDAVEEASINFGGRCELLAKLHGQWCAASARCIAIDERNEVLAGDEELALHDDGELRAVVNHPWFRPRPCGIGKGAPVRVARDVARQLLLCGARGPAARWRLHHPTPLCGVAPATWPAAHRPSTSVQHRLPILRHPAIDLGRRTPLRDHSGERSPAAGAPTDGEVTGRGRGRYCPRGAALVGPDALRRCGHDLCNRAQCIHAEGRVGRHRGRRALLAKQGRVALASRVPKDHCQLALRRQVQTP